jgi:hypothetical protein
MRTMERSRPKIRVIYRSLGIDIEFIGLVYDLLGPLQQAAP